MDVLGKAGLLLLSFGGITGTLLYLAMGKPKGWLGMKQLARFRQGHVDGLITGTVLVVLSSAQLADAVATWLLIAGGFYVVLSTTALAWWPDWTEKSRWFSHLDLMALSSFSLGLVWITVLAFL